MNAPWVRGPVLAVLLLAACSGPAESTSSTATTTPTSVVAKTAHSQPPLTTASRAASSIATLPVMTALPYEADWSDGMAGWGGSDDWQTANGLLKSDGTSYSERAGVIAPIELGSGDFAIDAEIKLNEYKDKGSSGGRASFGISARVQRNGAGYGAGHCFSLGRYVPVCAGSQQGEHRAVLWTNDPVKTSCLRSVSSRSRLAPLPLGGSRKQPRLAHRWPGRAQIPGQYLSPGKQGRTMEQQKQDQRKDIQDNPTLTRSAVRESPVPSPTVFRSASSRACLRFGRRRRLPSPITTGKDPTLRGSVATTGDGGVGSGQRCS